MRKRTSIMTAAAVFAFTGAAGATTQPANATTFTEGGACDTAKQTSGECLTFAIREGENPVVAAVRQTLTTGGKEQAGKFVSLRAQTASDDTQADIQKLLEQQSASPTGEPEVGALVHGSVPNKWTWKLTDTITFGYCNQQTCTNVDYLEVDYSTTVYHAQEAVFDGYMKTRYGWRFDLKGHSCTVHHERPLLPDTQVGYFGECGTLYNISQYDIFPGRSNGMVRDARNYVMVGLRFKPVGSDKDFVFNWESYHWYVDPSGNQWFY